MDEAATRELARNFFDTVERGDFDAFVAFYAPDGQVWNNGDQLVRTPRQIADLLKEIDGLVTERQYADRHLNVFPGGFVQRHLFAGTRRSDGKRIEAPACLVAEIGDGKITRTYDYIDSAMVAEFYK